MKVGDLIRHKQTGKISIVVWCYDTNGTHFTVAGFPRNQVFNLTAWEVISEGR